MSKLWRIAGKHPFATGFCLWAITAAIVLPIIVAVSAGGGAEAALPMLAAGGVFGGAAVLVALGSWAWGNVTDFLRRARDARNEGQ